MLFNFKKTTDSIIKNKNDSNNIDITQLNNGEKAKVIELFQNNNIARKLEAMGIIPGTIITKKSSILSKGPIIIEKGQTQLAIGYELAQNIIVIKCVV